MEVTHVLDVRGMHCAACAAHIEKVVSKIDGVVDMNVNLTTEKGRVTLNNNRTSLGAVIDKVNQIGFQAKKESTDRSQSDQDKMQEIRTLSWRFIFSALLTVPLAWAMLTHFNAGHLIYIPALLTHPFFQLALILPIQFIIGFPFYEGAWNALKSGSANMDVLVVLSTSAAFFYSHYLTFTSLPFSLNAEPIVLYYETSAFIITFILLGKLLEAKTMLKTRVAIKSLYKLQTKTATQYKNGKTQAVPVEHLVPGDVVTLKPGASVPIDGEVIKGSSMINESLLTGESIPVEKQLGHPVYAGTINQNGALHIKVTKSDAETALSQIIRVVEEAQASKAPIQHIADKITGVFVPIIILIAVLTFAAWYTFLQPGEVNEAVEKVIAVLIIACPCALGLATPTSVMVGSGRAAQLGILFKEGTFLELLGKCKTVLFDKTGTLTKGFPQVTDIYAHRLSNNALLEVVGAVEQDTEHPIAQAIANTAKKKIPFLPVAEDVLAIPGHGVTASVNGNNVVIANPSYFLKHHIFLPEKAHQVVHAFGAAGKTVMIILLESRFAGVIAVADELKTSSSLAVARLQHMGLDTVMLTGDSQKAGTAVAKKVGIHHFQTEVTPQDKAHIIRQLQQNGEKVVMVGDGINDAPALAAADVGVAMGTGADIAVESGDITIIKGDLERFVDALTISKKTMINIKQNLFWAFLYNVIMIPFAILGFLAPWLAGAAMAFSSVSVVLNALRLKKVRI